MDGKKLEGINAIIGEFYDDISSLSEELVDDNLKEADVIIDNLIKKLKHLKTNIKDDEI